MQLGVVRYSVLISFLAGLVAGILFDRGLQWRNGLAAADEQRSLKAIDAEGAPKGERSGSMPPLATICKLSAEYAHRRLPYLPAQIEPLTL